MNNPDSLLRIAEKACDFDRVHFANGNVSTAETLASCHERLATDPKLITRLLFRHAVVLAFFEGYVQAVDDCANATESQSIGIVKKPPPPPPSAAPPKPEEISDELAQAAADYTNGIYSVNCTPSEVRHSLNVVVKNKWEQAVAGFIEGARWQLARTPSMPANEVQNSERAQYEKTIELVNMRCNELQSELSETENERLTMKDERDRALAKVRAWEARTGETDPRIAQEKIASGSPVEPTTSLTFRDENERDFWDEQVHALNRRGDRSARDVASAADEMVEERRKRIPQTTTSDSIGFAKVVHEQIVELGHGCSWSKEEGGAYLFLWSGAKRIAMLDVDEMIATGRTVNEAVEILLAHAPKPNEAKEISDELLLEGAEWANSFCDMASVPCDLASAKSAMNGNVVFELRWSNAVRSYVSGAIRKARKT